MIMVYLHQVLAHNSSLFYFVRNKTVDWIFKMLPFPSKFLSWICFTRLFHFQKPFWICIECCIFTMYCLPLCYFTWFVGKDNKFIGSPLKSLSVPGGDSRFHISSPQKLFNILIFTKRFITLKIFKTFWISEKF